MDFILKNYLWIIFVVIIILMAIVGYIADKTGFIAKAEKPTTKFKGKKEQPVVIEDKGIDELLDSPVELDIIEENVKGDKNIRKSKKNKKEKIDFGNAIVNNEYDDIDTVNQEFVGSVENDTNDTVTNVNFDIVNEDLAIPFVSDTNDTVMDTNFDMVNEDLTTPLVSDVVNNDNDVIDESLFAPLESTEFNGNEEAKQELNPIEVASLQNVNANEEVVVDPEDDIWKF